ncbi:hypothetical protein BDF21DRAFT_427626 [Thamnidium elegans]|nr:hypothetical protein BDF21DRAFT_427626 [Thamnidium elegans]
MTTSFANLLRHSRLATYDRSISQVYTTPLKRKEIGDWGLKRNLPTVIRTKHLTVGALDTSEHQTPWESGDGKVLFVKRWKENFPNSTKPTPRSEETQHNIASMTPAEFQRFLRQSQKKASAFQEALAKKEMVPEQLYDYLSVSFSENADTDQSVVGPTYSDHQIGWDYPVQGRVLNAERQGSAVGIAGVVAILPKRNSIGLRNAGDRNVRTFYVRNAELDSQGKPKIEVTLSAKGSTSSIPLLNNYENYDSIGFSNDRYENRQYNAAPHNHHNRQRRNNDNSSMSAEDMINMRSRRRAQGPESEDNIKPNPEHTDLMARIAGLLDNTKDKK